MIKSETDERSFFSRRNVLEYERYLTFPRALLQVMNLFTIFALFLTLASAYPFVLFPAVLAVLARTGRSPSTKHAPELPRSVSVIIAARDEVGHVRSRVENLRSVTPPGVDIEIIIGSDGSADDTVKVARSLGADVVVHDFSSSRGRALVHNDCVAGASGEILVFTDADTVFGEHFFEAILTPFADPQVGVAVGELSWLNLDTGAATSGRGLYWSFELLLRRLMSDSGTLTKGTGACMAVRRSLWVDLLGHEDVDVMTPVEVVCAGKRVVHVPEAIAADVAPATASGVFRSNRRMTRKTTLGLTRGVRRLVKHRRWKHAWAVVSHKILRFTSLGTLVAAFLVGLLGGQLGLLLSALIGAVLLVGGVGALLVISNRRIPLLSAVGTWTLATAGMTVGVVDALRGDTASTYSKVA